MPSLRDRSGPVSGYETIPEKTTEMLHPPTVDLQPNLSPLMRCPLPPVSGISPDALRQFYRGGILPQRRLLTSMGTTGAGGGTGGTSTINPTVNISNGGGQTTVVPASAKLLGSDSKKKIIPAALTNAHVYIGNPSNKPVDVAISKDINLQNTGAATVIGLEGVLLDAATVGHPTDGQVITYVSADSRYEAIDLPGGGGIQSVTGSEPIHVTAGSNPIVSLDYSNGLTLDGSDFLELNLGSGLSFDVSVPHTKVFVNVPASTFAIASDGSKNLVAALRSGNTAVLGTVFGTTPVGHIVEFDAFGNLVDGGLPSAINFADDEQVSGSGTSWTLVHAPSPTASLMLFQRLTGFGGVLLIQGTDYTLSGTTVTTTNSLSTGVLYAFYRY